MGRFASVDLRTPFSAALLWIALCAPGTPTRAIDGGNTGGVSFVLSARQAYDRWSSSGGLDFTDTSSTSNTSFSRFCSSQAYAPDTFGPARGFVDPLYITGEEVSDGRLFVLDSAGRDFYQLSGTVGSATGGIGGMPFDSWENAALVDTGETQHVAARTTWTGPSPPCWAARPTPLA